MTINNRNAVLLYRALTHRSYIFENPTQTDGDNEQLEFLSKLKAN